MKTSGYSLFGQVKPLKTVDLAFFGRYDYFDSDKDDVIADLTAYKLLDIGASYALSKGNLILVSYETTDYETDAAGKSKIPVAGTNLGDDNKLQMVFQIKY